MSEKGKTLLKGHTLFFEGQPVGGLMRNGIGKGKCSCGVYSSELESNAQRKRWHRQHKDDIRKQGPQ